MGENMELDLPSSSQESEIQYLYSNILQHKKRIDAFLKHKYFCFNTEQTTRGGYPIIPLCLFSSLLAP
jgi:hypothetical protein